MRILVANDDGIRAPGLRTLVQVLSREHEVYVCAPNEEKSAFSHSVTYWRIRNRAWKTVVPGAVEAYAVDGTPGDCVYHGIFGLWDRKPDLVISGINQGENISSDILYSGTIGAASEGIVSGVPSMAVSLCSFTDSQFETAAEIVLEMIPYYMNDPERLEYVCSINVPAIPKEEIKGVRIARQEGKKVYKQKVTVLPQEDGSYLLECAGGPGTIDGARVADGDVTLIDDGYVTVTPIGNNLADHDRLSDMKKWNSIVL